MRLLGREESQVVESTSGKGKRVTVRKMRWTGRSSEQGWWDMVGRETLRKHQNPTALGMEEESSDF